MLRTISSLDTTVMRESQTDLDSHADQCAVSRNSLIVHDYSRPINVAGYNPKGPVEKGLCTVSAALAYVDPTNGTTVILMVHQAIYIPAMTHNLLSPMQLRLNDVIVNDIPRFLCEQPDEFTHSIIIPRGDEAERFVIPLALDGVTSTFPTRKPTSDKYERLLHLTRLTSESPPYDPHDTFYAEHESAFAKVDFTRGYRSGPGE
jgi:hypothetical protein